MNIALLEYTHPQLKKILQYKPKHIEQIKAAVPGAHITVIDSDSSESQRVLKDADIIVMSPLDHAGWVDFASMPNLRWVQLTSAGASEVSARLRHTDVLLTNASGVHPIPIAEHVCAYMLMFARRLHISYRTQLLQQRWSQDGIVEQLMEFSDSIVGIVGFGRIGERVARMAKGLDANVLALTHKENLREDSAVDTFYHGDEGLRQLIRSSDFIVNCLPLTAETQGYFNKELFKLMKPTAYFINIGRGKTVVQDDLITALLQKQIAGAGLDVFADEPLPAESQLWTLDDVILTPHYAGWTPRYIDRVVDIFCRNMRDYMQGTTMHTLVDKEKGY